MRIFPWPKIAFIDGITVYLRRSPMDPHMKKRLLRGGYDTAERAMVRNFVREDDQVLELGGSLGILTCLIAKKAAKGRVVSVEADPLLANVFHHQLKINNLSADLVHALGCPIWADEVPVSWQMRGFASAGESNLSGRAVARDAGGPGTNTTPWKTAKQIAEATALTPTVIVVDIEGAEAIWAEQSPEIPPHVRLVIVETHPNLTGDAIAGASVQALIEEGFRIAAIQGTVFALLRPSHI